MRLKSFFVCSSCGYKSVSQMGKCPECGEWGTMVEEVEQTQGPASAKASARQGRVEIRKPVRIGEIKQEGVLRITTGFSEVDRVLGGGMVAGSVILIAGEPGVGKSTLLLQMAAKLTSSKFKAQSSKKKEKEEDEKIVLYVSGEESENQLKIRFERLANLKSKSENVNLKNEKNENLFVLNETNVDLITRIIEEVKPTLLIVDSVQTIYTEDLSGTAGSVGQVRECAYRLSNVCKNLGIPLFLVGQITKEGAIAGPKVLEHLVDVVLYFEGEHFQNLRILRSVKNRFGPIDEAGIFEMGDAGLLEVANPSEIFLGEHRKEKKTKTGAVVTCTLEGTRPLLVEIQALTVYSTLPMPRRVFSGLDFNRCQVVLAVLQKYLNIDFSHLDVYVSVSGGLKIKEPSADAAIALALVSSVKNIYFDAVCYGEIGLLGDIRRVNNSSLRKKECHRLGYKSILSADEVSNIREIIRSQDPKIPS